MPKVLLIGWDAADWKVIEPLMAAGKMPSLQAFLREGVHGNLATLQPVLSPMLWTSIASGKRAWQHGIHGFVEATPDGSALRPVNVSSRKVKAIWNIFTQNGLRSNVVGWWPSHPAEPIHGCMVSNFYQKGSEGHPDLWPLEREAIHPPELYEKLKSLRFPAAHLTAEMLLPFIPKARELDITSNIRLQNCLKVLSHAASIHNASTYLLEHKACDFMAIYHDAIDHFSHLAMRFHPPKREHIKQEDFEIYQEVVSAAYMFHDMMLDRLLQMVEPDTYVMLISDHGFHSDHLRPTVLPIEPAAPAHEHRHFGIFALKGPGIKQNEKVYGSSLLDIAPTLLHLFGLPVGRDMEGSVLIQCFEKAETVNYIDSWEQIPGYSGQHLFAHSQNENAAEGLKQLEDLGYIEPIGSDKRAHMTRALRENRYNLAVSYLDGGKYREAYALLQELWEEDPTAFRYLDKLVRVAIRMKEAPKAAQWLKQIEDENLKNSPRLLFLESLIATATGQFVQAQTGFDKLLKLAPQDVGLINQVAVVYQQKMEYAPALEHYLKAISLDVHNTLALTGAGFCLLRLGRYEEALDRLLESVEQLYAQPKAHFYLGECLKALGAYEQSAQAFEIAHLMNPGSLRILLQLEELYGDFLNQKEKAEYLKQTIQQLQSDAVVVVSGLPRSGTSLMMQMLESLGLETLTDQSRLPDESNPKGYFELDAVKRLGSDKDWLKQAHGKVVKVVAPLLPLLPAKQRYKVVYMRRSMAEIVVSQQVMLGKNRAKAMRDFPLAMANTLENQQQKAFLWMQSQPHIDFIEIDFERLMERDAHIEALLKALLEKDLPYERIWTALDPSLYRSKLI